mgnify:CR=1 FL=1
MSWKQFLTEKVLKERILVEKPERCKTCKGLDCNDCADNRTFDNRNDLLDLYEAINRDGKIWQFEKVCWEKLKTEFPSKTMEDILNLVTPWMFCLSGKGYEDRCRMAAEFYGWEEADHDQRRQAVDL